MASLPDLEFSGTVQNSAQNAGQPWTTTDGGGDNKCDNDVKNAFADQNSIVPRGMVSFSITTADSGTYEKT